jgi:hypothetical protein
VTDDVLDWDSRPVRVARSRGGVMALCDVRRALLHDPRGEWPPSALKPKLKRSAQIKAFDPPGSADLQECLGFYCDLQSVASEDAMTWSFFGPFLSAAGMAQARLLNWLLDLAGVEHEPNATCEIRLWRRLPHPDTGQTRRGPEPDFALYGDRCLVLGEAKWSTKEDRTQGVFGTTSQMEMRRQSLAAEAHECGGEAQLVALGIVLSESLEAPPPDADGIATRIVEWKALARYPDHPTGDEFAAYYEWKLAHLPRRRPRASTRESQIRRALKTFASGAWGEAAAVPHTAAGLCFRASLVLLEMLHREGVREAKLWFLAKPRPGFGLAESDIHYVVLIGTEVIDATGRQFDPGVEAITRRTRRDAEAAWTYSEVIDPDKVDPPFQEHPHGIPRNWRELLDVEPPGNAIGWEYPGEWPTRAPASQSGK